MDAAAQLSVNKIHSYLHNIPGCCKVCYTGSQAISETLSSPEILEVLGVHRSLPRLEQLVPWAVLNVVLPMFLVKEAVSWSMVFSLRSGAML